MTPASSRRIKILIVDDNPTDTMLVQMALEEAGLVFVAEVAEDGEAAIQRLSLNGEGPEANHPDLIILDLNLPKRDGTEVLQMMSGRRDLAHIPVVVLSSSPSYVIEHRAIAANVTASCYLTKSPNLDDFLALGKAIRQCFDSAQESRSSATSVS